MTSYSNGHDQAEHDQAEPWEPTEEEKAADPLYYYPLKQEEIHLSYFDRRVGKLPAYALPKLWKKGEYRPDRYFWCEQCHRVWKIDKAFQDGIMFCARCEASADALHWWDKWPQRAFENWVPEPEEGSYWFLDGYVWDSLLYRGGLGAHRIPYEDGDREEPGDVNDDLGDFSDSGGEQNPNPKPMNLPTDADADKDGL